MELQTAKGVKDYMPEEMIPRQRLLDSLRNIFESYGFVPLQTPIIERIDILSAKYAGGDEILKETFRFKDQGDRDLGLRYDLTVPLARFVGMNPNLRLPFKRYQIGQVFRDGPIKAGRAREFTQCDVDIVGCKTMLADAECVKVALDVFDKLGLKVNVEINNRKILDGILASLGIKEDKWVDIILTIDKIKKIDRKDIEKELKQKGLNDDLIEKLLLVFEINGTNKEKIKKLKGIVATDLGKEGLKEIEELFSYLDKNAVFNVSLARGLAYYTSTVFEAFLADGSFTSSLAGGGRYDKMIGDYLESKREFPALGISFGIEPINEILKLKQETSSVARVYISPIKSSKEGMKIAAKLRKAGINVELDIMERGISKNLDYANSKKIPYVIIFGEKELKEGKVKLKDMNSGEEKDLKVEEVIKILK